MTPQRAREGVVMALIGTGAVVTLGGLAGGKPPSPRQFLALGIAFVGISGVATVAPPLGAGLAGLTFAGALVNSASGGRVFDALTRAATSVSPITPASARSVAAAPSAGGSAPAGGGAAALPGGVGMTTPGGNPLLGPSGSKSTAAGIAVAQAARKGVYDYKQVRPIPRDISAGRIVTDCSGFVTMVYRAAGLPDPNGRGYDGQGYTGTLWAHGTPTRTPQIGDLCFYGTPALPGGAAHVGIIVSPTDAVSFGSNAYGGPHRHSIHYRPDFAGFRSY